MSFGSTLKQLREPRRISQSKLAERAGFDHSYVSRLESGARKPAREAVEQLADALEATLAERDQLLTSAGFAGTVDATALALMDVSAERRRQTAKWGVQSLTWPEWILVLTEEVGEAAQAVNDAYWHGAELGHLREELVQVAAVAVQIIEAIDADQAEGHAAA